MRATLTSLEYSNLRTGGPALATLGCLLRGLARRAPDPAARGNRKLGHRGGPWHRDANLRRPDLRALAQRRSGYPGLDWHQLIASDREFVLFRVTDRPIHDAFGLFQAEEEA